MSERAHVDLYWLPLGAGGHSVRMNGKVFEWFAARLEHRDRCDLYHSALQVCLPEARFVVEQAPVWREEEQHGVVAEGAVGVRALGRLPLFRYEVRCWREGSIPDASQSSVDHASLFRSISMVRAASEWSIAGSRPSSLKSRSS